MQNDLISTMPAIPSGYKARKPIPAGIANKADPMFRLVDECRTVVEIGSQWGWWAYRALKFCSGNPNIYCIDPWEKESHRFGKDNFYEWALNLRPWIGTRIFGMRMKSADAARKWKSFGLGPIDLIFIDGDHSEKSVYNDCRLWTPLVRTGGLLVGHDVDGKWGPGVRLGVHRYFDRIERCPDVDYDYVYWTLKGKRLSRCWIVRKIW